MHRRSSCCSLNCRRQQYIWKSNCFLIVSNPLAIQAFKVSCLRMELGHNWLVLVGAFVEVSVHCFSLLLLHLLLYLIVLLVLNIHCFIEKRVKLCHQAYISDVFLPAVGCTNLAIRKAITDDQSNKLTHYYMIWSASNRVYNFILLRDHIWTKEKQQTSQNTYKSDIQTSKKWSVNKRIASTCVVEI